MNARAVAALAFRLTGAFWLYRAAVSAGNLVNLVAEVISLPPDLVSRIETILPWLAWLVVSVAIPLVVIWQADRIARWLVPGDDHRIELAVNEHHVLSAALCILGLYLVGISIPALVKGLTQYGLLDRVIVDSPNVSSRKLLISLSGYAAQLLFGLFLFLQAGGIARFWRDRQKSVPSEGSE